MNEEFNMKEYLFDRLNFCWDCFKATGSIIYYLLYSQAKKEFIKKNIQDKFAGIKSTINNAEQKLGSVVKSVLGGKGKITNTTTDKTSESVG